MHLLDGSASCLKRFVGGKLLSAACLPRNSVSEPAQRGSEQLVSNCALKKKKKAEQRYISCDKFEVVLFNLYILSGNIYIQMQGLALL